MNTNTKENFLNICGINWLILGLGLTTLVYTYVVFFTPPLSDFAGFIGMVVMGAVY